MSEGLKKGWTKVAFGDVVRLVKERSSDPAADGFDRYVGLEHLDPGELKIRRWGDVADGTTFTSVFRAGQVLFGKRRAYQRKLAVADFDGVCSGDIYVFEPKNSQLLPELLPFICQTDIFFEYAIGTSAGSLSPRTNWKSLAEYEFALPPMEEQRRIACVLESIEATVSKLIMSIDSGFNLQQAISDREFKSEIVSNHTQLGDYYIRVTEQVDSQDDSVSNKPLITPENITKKTGEIINNYGLASDAMSSKFLFAKGAVLYSRIRPYFQKVTVAPFDGICSTEIYPLVPNEKIIPEYLMDLLLSSSFTRYAIAGMKGTGFPRVSHDYIDKFPVKIPFIEKQKEYLNIINPFKRIRKATHGRLEKINMLKKDIMDGM